MVVHMEDASQMKTFEERPDIFKARTEAGADVVLRNFSNRRRLVA